MQTKKENSRVALTVFISAIFIFIFSIPQLSAEPYVYYHLDGDGTDAGSNGLDLTVNEDQLTWVEGINGQAAFIKEGNNFNPLSMNEMHGSGDWTFEAWVKLDNLDEMWITCMNAGAFTFGYNMMLTNSFEFSTYEWATYPLTYSFAGRWFHFAGVYREGQSIQLFINGKKVAENVPSYNHDFSNKHSLYIGRSEGFTHTREFTIDEVAIHNAALSPEDFIGMQYYVEQPIYIINGQITDSSTGEGIPGAVITAEPGGFVVATGNNGDFTIDLPMGGEFNITVDKTNYTSTIQQGIVVAADIPVTVNAALERFSSSPIVADYHFDGNGEDASGNGYDLTVGDDVTWTDGIQGKAAVLENTEPYPFEMPQSGLIYPGSGDITCELLIYIHDPGNEYTYFCIQNYSYVIQFITNYKNEMHFESHLRSFSDHLTLKVPFNDYYDEWIHVALVYRYKESLQSYINGELVAEQETDIVPGIFPRDKLFISGTGGKYIIDELRISHSALSPEQFLFMETHVEEYPSPSEFSITGNYPNPFNPTTTIEFTIPETGHINLSIYNITGQKIRELVAEEMTAGIHSVMWDGRDEKGMMVSSGIYISSLKSGEHVTAKRMLLLK